MSNMKSPYYTDEHEAFRDGDDYEVRVNAIGGGAEEIMRDLAARQMKL